MKVVCVEVNNDFLNDYQVETTFTIGKVYDLYPLSGDYESYKQNDYLIYDDCGRDFYYASITDVFISLEEWRDRKIDSILEL